MATTTISPNMNLPVPVVSNDPGPDWANNVNACLGGIDSHNHSTGQGVQITPSGLNINADLPLGGNNLTTARSVRLSAQGSPLATGADVGCLYESGVDLYYNDGAGNQVRITQSGSVTGATGTITGLPSGTASASFAGGTFTFQSATSTPATMAVGPLVIGRNAASSKTVSLTPNASQPADYGLVLPTALPTSNNQLLRSDASGNTDWVYAPIGQMPVGSVIGTFPNLTGAYSCSATTVADAAGFVKCNGQTISDASSPMDGAVIPNINNGVFLAGATTAGSTTSLGTAAGPSVTLVSGNLASHVHTGGSYATSVGVTGGTASLTGTTTFSIPSHTHNFAHEHQWLFTNTGLSVFSYGLTTPSSASTGISASNIHFFEKSSSDISTGAGNAAVVNSLSGSQNWYTTGAIDAPSGSGSTATTSTGSASASVGISSTGASMTGSNSVLGSSGATGSGTAFSILPTYITTLYIMRIK